MLSVRDSFILITALFVSIYLSTRIYFYKNIDNYRETDVMRHTMGGILIVFGFLKIVNLRGFVKIFSKYDIFSRHFEPWGYVYPFLEIYLGILLLKGNNLSRVYKVIIAIMSISIVSVLESLRRGVQLRCGCIGSIFHIPLSYVTLSENVVMIIMSTYLLKA